MSAKRILLGLILVAALGASGAFAVGSLKAAKAPSPSEVTLNFEKSQDAASSSDSDAPSSHTEAWAQDREEGKQVTIKFILAAANPSRPSTSADKQRALGYLSAQLKQTVANEHGGDPFKLLGLAAPAKFSVGAYTIKADRQSFVVTFQTAAGPQDITFELVKENGARRIDAITPVTK